MKSKSICVRGANDQLLQKSSFNVIVVTKDKPSAMKPYLGKLASDIQTDPGADISRALEVTRLPQIVHFRDGTVVWSRSDKQSIIASQSYHFKELGMIKSAEGMTKSLDKETGLLKSLDASESCKK